jgi:hypothetical protein
VAEQAVLGLTSALAGLRGKRFNGADAARAFLVGELQSGIAHYIDQHRTHYDGHIDREDLVELKKLVTREAIAGLDAIILPSNPRRPYYT